jgi:phosphoribosylformylglycinamidine cyclo-ligase
MSDHVKDPYANAGVEYGLLDAWKRNAQAAAARTATNLQFRRVTELKESRGESAYVIDVGQALLASVTEGLGTKNLVADAVRPITGRTHYDSIAQDTIATILNDLATVGAAPLTLTAFWAAGSSEWFADSERMSDLVSGWERACATAKCVWGGGETQTLVDMIDPKTAVLGGAALGWVSPKGRLLSGDRLTESDAILVAPAVGIHTNGLTLARKLAQSLPEGYATKVPGDPKGRGFGEALLDPTPLYGRLVETLQEAGIDLHYAVHVTGHGWRKLMRAERELSYIIDSLPAPPPVLSAMQQWANLSPAEAYGTFNMGAGFALFVPRSQVQAAAKTAKSGGWDLLHIGNTAGGPRRVVLRPNGVTFEGTSLQIRNA